MTGVVLALCLMAVPAGLQEPADEAATLIGQLGAPAFRDREAAERALETLGEPALPALRRAQQHTDAEVRHRVRRLIKRIAVVSDADLQTLRADLFELLRAEEPPAQVLTLVRRRLERFAAAHRVRVPGAARTFRSSDGRVVCVIGRSARQPSFVPGKRYVSGRIQRQYSRRVSSSFGLSGTDRSRPPLPWRIWTNIRSLSMSSTLRWQSSARRIPVE